MIALRAPAKLNLYLRVLHRRPDGYHEIETLFERLDLADELTFELQPSGIALTCSDSHLSCEGDNLVLKAARLLQRTSGTSRGARIHLTKRIPLAAGLGGGSSNAAATLVGLTQLWELSLAPEQLIELAATLGADVPFFLAPAPFAVGRGRGEVCEPVSGPHLAHVLVVPEKRLSTQEVYTKARFNLTAPKPSINMVLHALSNGSPRELAKGLWNDLEPEAIRRCPAISSIQKHLRDLGCLTTLVSGSGSAVFGLCSDPVHAHDIAARLRTHAPPPKNLVGGHAPQPWRIDVVQTDPSLTEPSERATALKSRQGRAADMRRQKQP